MVIALTGLSAIAAQVQDLRRRVSNLEKHGAVRRATVDITEDSMAQTLVAVEHAEATLASLKNILDRAEFIRNGGSPDAPWSEVYRKKNAKT